MSGRRPAATVGDRLAQQLRPRIGFVLSFTGSMVALLVVLTAFGNAGDVELSAAEALLIGAVEGATEYLPVSSTAHLLVLQDLLGLTEHPESADAADSYAIVIQGGAILAVGALYRRRIASVVAGTVGRSDDGRRIGWALVVAFAPAALVGLLLGDTVKAELFSTWPIVAAWVVGGLVSIIVPIVERPAASTLEAITLDRAAMIGAAQILALWPGTSRSLVTLVAGLAVGLTLVAAVEFSFLLGFVTLSAATVYEAWTGGPDILDAFGPAAAVLGFVSSTVTAWLAVRWMLAFLQKRPLAAFGWYRIGVALATAWVAVFTSLL